MVLTCVFFVQLCAFLDRLSFSLLLAEGGGDATKTRQTCRDTTGPCLGLIAVLKHCRQKKRAISVSVSCVLKCTKVGFVLSVVFVVAGCGGPAPGGPAPSATPDGCKAIQKELKRFENKGVAGWAEAKNAGKKLSKSKEAGLRTYNELLNKYLGGKCHL